MITLDSASKAPCIASRAFWKFFLHHWKGQVSDLESRHQFNNSFYFTMDYLAWQQHEYVIILNGANNSQ
jgi:hypothetical protein